MVGQRETGNETYIVNIIRAMVTLGHGDGSGTRFEVEGQFVRPSFRLVVFGSPALRATLPTPANATVSLAGWAPALIRLGIALPIAGRAHRLDVLHCTYVGPVFLPC